MTDRIIIPITNRQQGIQALRSRVEPFIVQNCQAERRYRLTIQPETRSLAQNARLHAMISDVARQAKWKGTKRSSDWWKAMFVSGWMIATEQDPEMEEGLEGEQVVIRESTATMSAKKCAGVMEYIEAWAAMNGVRFTAREWEIT